MSAVADGAGTAAQSEIGATVATQTAVDLAIRLIEDRGSGFTDRDVTACFEAVHDALEFEAQQRGVSVRDLACTLLVAVLGPKRSYYGQIGDGAIVIETDGVLRRAVPAESTEFVNVTQFVTSSNYLKHLRLMSALTPDWVAVVTDGVEFLCIDEQTGDPSPGFFAPFVAALRAECDQSQLVVPTSRFLQSERVNARTNDDKTLLLAVSDLIILRTGSGLRVVLGVPLGSPGGEGAVYAVEGSRLVAAKVYHLDKRARREEKVCAMVREAVRIDCLAWPLDTLYDGASFCGFLMNRIPVGYKSHYSLMTHRREVEFPGIDWKFLLGVSENLARVIANFHHRGFVIGDVKYDNIFVNRKGFPYFVDVDSFHLTLNNNLYPCEVGLDEYIAPEFQNLASLSDAPRGHSQDVFALGVLVFQLLFMGCHPFAGLGTPPDLREAIKSRSFPYSNLIPGQGPPPGSPPLVGVGLHLSGIFERTFLARSPLERPTAANYVAAIGSVHRGLRQCSKNSRHWHIASLSACPWCSLRHDYFPPVRTPRDQLGHENVHPIPINLIEIAELWSAVLGIAMPAKPASLVEILPSMPAHVSDAPVSTVRTGFGVGGGIAALTSLVFEVWWSAENGWSGRHAENTLCGMICYGFAIALVGALTGAFFDREPAHRKRVELVKQAQARAELAQREISAAFDCSVVEFSKERARIENCYKFATNMQVELARRKADVDRAMLSDVMETALRSIFLDENSVSGVAATRLSMLRSFGIESAWDVFQAGQARNRGKGRLESVPMVGPVLADRLIQWAERVRQDAPVVLNQPARTIRHREVEVALCAEIGSHSESLRRGRGILEQIRDSCINRVASAELKYRAERAEFESLIA